MDLMRQVSLSIVILSSIILVHHCNEGVHVVPTESCSDEECISFGELLQNTSRYFVMDSQVVFTPGEYSVEKTVQVVVQDVRNLTLSLVGEGASINCNGNLSFMFMNITRLHISGLNFSRCGLQVSSLFLQNFVRVHDMFSNSALFAAIFLANVADLVIINVRISHSQGFGIFGINVGGNSIIEHSTIIGDAHQASSPLHTASNTESDPDVRKHLVDCNFGNMWFLFEDHSDNEGNQHKLCFNSVHLVWMSNELYYCSTKGSNIVDGLKIEFQQNNYSLEILIKQYTSEGAKLYVVGYGTGNTSVKITNSHISTAIVCTFHREGNINNRVTKTIGQTLFEVSDCFFSHRYSHLLHICMTSDSFDLSSSILLRVKHCHFRNNGIYITSRSTVKPTKKIAGRLEVLHCKFFSTGYFVSGAIYLHFKYSRHLLLSSVLIQSCVFNGGYDDSSAIRAVGMAGLVSMTISHCSILSGGVYLTGMTNVTISYTTFENNSHSGPFNEEITSGALGLEGSTVYFKGDITFRNNEGSNGGAISLIPYILPDTSKLRSTLYFHPHTHVNIVNNMAVNKGGGIFQKESSDTFTHRNTLLCFYQVAGWDGRTSLSKLDIKITLLNNSALVAGDSIFGGLHSLCYITGTASKQSAADLNAFDILFDIKNNKSSSELSTFAQQICLCNPMQMTPYCEKRIRQYKLSAYPGQIFDIPAVVLGGNLNFYVEYGALPDVIFSSVTPSSSAQLGHLQDVQRLPRKCGNLTFSIYSAELSTPIHLSMYMKPVERDTLYNARNDFDHITFVIGLLACPLGFQLAGQPPKCECIKLLTDNNCKCFLGKKTAVRLYREILDWWYSKHYSYSHTLSISILRIKLGRPR